MSLLRNSLRTFLKSGTRLQRCYLSTDVYDHMPRPSPEYLKNVGEQPIPGDNKPEEPSIQTNDTQESPDVDEEKQIKKAMVRRSLRMTFWEMFLVTFIGSCALNIIVEGNTEEEYRDNYKHRFEKFNEIIDGLKKGDTTVEDIDNSLSALNERFETVFHLPPSTFEGTEGLDKKKLKALYHKYKGVPLEDTEAGSLESSAEPAADKELDTFI